MLTNVILMALVKVNLFQKQSKYPQSAANFGLNFRDIKTYSVSARAWQVFLKWMMNLILNSKASFPTSKQRKCKF